METTSSYPENHGSTITSWTEVLAPEKEKEYFRKVMTFTEQERSKGKRIYPPKHEVFEALKATPFDRVRVVIIGQDPYHGPGQAHGLCFSVREEVPVPPSLHNIFKEIHEDLHIPIPSHGCLRKWAEQGVLLLNAVLTVEEGKAGSHASKGWELFTDKIIEVLNKERDGLVFLLWGAYAKKKAATVDPERHLVLTAPHPSPLSAHAGFFGCKHFSKTNEYFISKGMSPIDWSF